MKQPISFKTLLVSTILTMVTVMAQAEQVPKDGVIHGGGGAGLKGGQSVDSYARRVDQIRGYKLVVEPVLENIKNKVPEVYNRLFKRIRLSSFYVIPNQLLVKLPAHNQGIPYGLTDLEQMAYNINSEVWFDDTSFSKQPEEAAGALLLHEIFMLDWIEQRNYKDINWSALHANVRKVGNYFRLFPGDDEFTAAEMANTFYGLNGYSRFRTKTQYDKDVAQINNDNAEYAQKKDLYTSAIKVELKQVCADIPSTEKIVTLSDADALLYAPVFRKLAEFVYLKSIWLDESPEMNSSSVAKRVSQSLQKDLFARLNTSGFDKYRDARNYFSVEKKKLVYQAETVKGFGKSLSVLCYDVNN